MSVWTGTGENKRNPAEPRPSASVVLISPKNQVLLLHRIKAASSFPSAHVFPGGNVDPKQDGTLPPSPSDPSRHADGPIYRLAAIRECFEESGLLLAKTTTTNQIPSLSDDERNEARRKIHDQELNFGEWLRERGAKPDVDGLHAFTRFITPTSVPKRFTTQMYIYFLPLEEEGDSGAGALTVGEKREMIPVPTHDGGVEHTAAQFLWPSQWLAMARDDEAIMYAPQVYLLSLINPFFPAGGDRSKQEVRVFPTIAVMDYGSFADFVGRQLEEQRRKCREFLKTGDPVWAEKVMCPDIVGYNKQEKKSVLGLYKPGPELEGSGRCGDRDRVITVRVTKEGPRNAEVRWRKDVMVELREQKANM